MACKCDLLLVWFIVMLPLDSSRMWLRFAFILFFSWFPFPTPSWFDVFLRQEKEPDFAFLLFVVIPTESSISASKNGDWKQVMSRESERTYTVKLKYTHEKEQMTKWDSGGREKSLTPETFSSFRTACIEWQCREECCEISVSLSPPTSVSLSHSLSLFSLQDEDDFGAEIYLL